MKKIIVLVLCFFLIITMLLSGCVQEDTLGENKITSQSEVEQTINDVGTDLSGISNSLDEINQTLTE
jgi:outer membrane lipoprotein-sorting protein